MVDVVGGQERESEDQDGGQDVNVALCYERHIGELEIHRCVADLMNRSREVEERPN